MGKAVTTRDPCTGATPKGSARSVVVEAPRPIDAIGGALRNAFAHGGAMPRDMAAMLAMIDRHAAPRGG